MLRLASARLGGCLLRAQRQQLTLQRATPAFSSRFSTSTTKEEEEAPPADAAAPATETPADTRADSATLLAEKDAAIADLNDRVLRALAEMENVRAIARRDVAQAREYGISSFAKGLLGVADTLTLALRAVPEERRRADGALRGLYEGVEGTERELAKVLAQNGVQRFGEKGDVFDPMRFQALFEVPTEEEEPGVVVEVTKTGYAMGERLLRPAEVGVSKAA